jgi:ferredoxin
MPLMAMGSLGSMYGMLPMQGMQQQLQALQQLQSMQALHPALQLQSQLQYNNAMHCVGCGHSLACGGCGMVVANPLQAMQPMMQSPFMPQQYHHQ